jgi:hypothetical protein
VRAWAAALTAFGAVAGAAGTAQAASFAMSELSSDTTPAAWLDATLELEVSGSSLRVSVANLTSGANSFDVAAIYWNVSADVLGLDYAGAPYDDEGSDWGLYDSGYYIVTARFGSFDYALVRSWTSNRPTRIAPGETKSFAFEIRCAPGAACDSSDFTTGFSSEGYVPAVAALRFNFGPGGDAAFGASNSFTVVPEPYTACLLAFGLVALARSRRGSARSQSRKSSKAR